MALTGGEPRRRKLTHKELQQKLTQIERDRSAMQALAHPKPVYIHHQTPGCDNPSDVWNHSGTITRGPNPNVGSFSWAQVTTTMTWNTTSLHTAMNSVNTATTAFRRSAAMVLSPAQWALYSELLDAPSKPQKLIIEEDPF